MKRPLNTRLNARACRHGGRGLRPGRGVIDALADVAGVIALLVIALAVLFLGGS